MDFREYAVVRENDEIVVAGVIRDPVSWDFTIRICEDDLPGIDRLALHPHTLGLLLRALFRRRKRHPWSQDHAAHLAEGRRRLAEARARTVRSTADDAAPPTDRRRAGLTGPAR